MANTWLPPFDPSHDFIVRRDRLLWKGQRYDAGDKFQKRHASIRQLKMLYEQRAISGPDQGGNRVSERSVTIEGLKAKAAHMLGAKAPSVQPEAVAPKGNGLDGVDAMVAAFSKKQLLEKAKSARVDVTNAMTKAQIAGLILESPDHGAA